MSYKQYDNLKKDFSEGKLRPIKTLKEGADN